MAEDRALPVRAAALEESLPGAPDVKEPAEGWDDVKTWEVGLAEDDRFARDSVDVVNVVLGPSESGGTPQDSQMDVSLSLLVGTSEENW